MIMLASVFVVAAQIVVHMENFGTEENVRRVLAKVETGCTWQEDHWKYDLKVGKAGEISRYQFKKNVLTVEELAKMPKKGTREFWKWADNITKRVLNERATRFFKIHERLPTLRETYILWNAPSYLIYEHQEKKIPKVIERRAEKFVKAWNEKTQ